MDNLNKRPHASESEEDILRLQQEFHRTQTIPSTKVKRVSFNETVQTAAAAPRPLTFASNLEDEFQFAQNDMGLVPLKVIKERQPTGDLDLKSFDLTPIPEQSLTEPTIRKDSSYFSKIKAGQGRGQGQRPTGGKRQSVFKQVSLVREKAKRELECGLEKIQISDDAASTSRSRSSQPKQPDREHDFGAEFHPICAGMTEEEILAEAKKLREKLDPKLVEFMRARQAKKKAAEEEVKVKVQPEVKGELVVKPEELPIHPEQVKKFVNMDKVEKEKLAWTLPVPLSEVKGQPEPMDSASGTQPKIPKAEGPGLNARFNFRGELVTKAQEDTWTKGLHHHGEEMERPGYTLEELLTLARSTNYQQRSLALDTLAAIFENTHFGMFDLTLDKSLFYLWTEMDFLYVIRTGMDQTDTAGVNSSLHCLAAMLYPLQEEMCLDTSYLWPSRIHPWISTTTEEDGSSDLPGQIPKIPENEGYQTSELTDPDVLDADLVEFLITRTNLLHRIDYLLRNRGDSLSETGILSALRILIRFARHSPDVLMEYEELLEVIAKNHANANWTLIARPRDKGSLKGTPLPYALKLFRILIDSSLKNARKLYAKLGMMTTVLSYLAYDGWTNQKHIKEIEFLVLEAFKIWRAFLNYSIGVDEYVSLFPVLMRCLHIFQRHDFLKAFDFNHATHLFSLLTGMLSMRSESESAHSHWPLLKDGVSFVSHFLVKLTALLSESRTAELCDFDLSLAAFEQGLTLIHLSKKYQNFDSISKPLSNFVKSSGYSAVTSQLISHSLILKKLTPAKLDKERSKYPPNFVTCGTNIFGGNLNPILKQKTPFPFLITLLRFLKGTGDAELAGMAVNADVIKYFDRVTAKLKTEIQSVAPLDNFFLRYELLCIAEFMEISPGLANFETSWKLAPLVQSSDPELFGRILENCLKGFGGCKASLGSEAIGQFMKALLTEGQGQEELEQEDLNFKKWKGKIIMSGHWILEPFRIWYDTYSSLETQSQEYYGKELVGGVRVVLELVDYLLEEMDGERLLLGTAADVRLFYTRMAACFLMGYDIFLETSIRPLLASILKKLGESLILRDNTKDVFLVQNDDESQAGKFESLYANLLGEFEGGSFGDEVFSAFILLPLRFGERPDLKLKLMSSSALPFMRVTEATSVIPLEYFTRMKETNKNIVAVFALALKSRQVRMERQPLLCQILKFHTTAPASE